MSRKKLSIAKKIWIGIGAFAVAACVFAIISSVTFPNFSRIYHLDKKMIDAIRPDGTLVMTDATNFEWDEMWVINANYAEFRYFGKVMGIELP
ncbi:MAG: hypothetical protein RR826_07535, partial [Christensenellaceae bacterium]